MDGTISPDGCGIYDLLDLLFANISEDFRRQPILRVRTLLRKWKKRIDQYNPAGRSQKNVAHHYDLNGRLYSLFLDRDRQYSCAYFPNGDETLEAAQLAKKRHIAAKLCLDRPNLEVLDIGCGWGGLALTLARDYGARVTGITLSREQLTVARDRAIAEGLEDRVNFELLDYRSVDRRFDRVVSVGMFEHVGIGYYQTYVDTVARCLDPGGVALLHAIGRSDGPACTNAWIDKYIFPGGYSQRCRRCYRRSRSRDLWRPISRSCDCIMRKRYGTGVGGSPLIATPSRLFTMSGSAECSSSICAAPSSRSVAAATWCFRSNSSPVRTRCR